MESVCVFQDAANFSYCPVHTLPSVLALRFTVVVAIVAWLLSMLASKVCILDNDSL